MKMNNRFLKGLMIAGMLTSVTVMQAQDLPHDTIKVMYPGDSAVVETPTSQDKLSLHQMMRGDSLLFYKRIVSAW